ncbi:MULTISPECIES: hypothetical protein [unclassified Roseitalea]|uniref:hypothetical protein n=1 Tax=unclassified Roseitalea TaxID=2639107 RepID=UPI00273F7E63|nr:MULTISPECIES: hypothetical protein [unclassified Roseitalea]
MLDALRHKRSGSVFATVATLALIVSQTALAQNGAVNPNGLDEVPVDPFADCDCIATPVPEGEPAAIVTQAEGGVLQLTSLGFQITVPGQELGPDGEVVTGPSSFAEIAISQECLVQLQSNQFVRLSTPAGPDGNICVRTGNTAPQVEQAAVEPTEVPVVDADGNVVAMLGLLGLIGIGGLAFAVGGGDDDDFGDGDDPASP